MILLSAVQNDFAATARMRTHAWVSSRARAPRSRGGINPRRKPRGRGGRCTFKPYGKMTFTCGKVGFVAVATVVLELAPAIILEVLRE